MFPSLEAAYEATLWAAVHAQRGASDIVFLTLLGRGAFGNPRSWIYAAMRRTLELMIILRSGREACELWRTIGGASGLRRNSADVIMLPGITGLLGSKCLHVVAPTLRDGYRVVG
jgi:hypothetical protein